jgi:multisubunit Na+/H+ antiporter MnhC subunit
MAFTGVVNSFNNVDCDTQDNCQPHVKSSHFPLYLLFLLSFHWTNTVIKNVVRVTVASAIGTWWFRPGDISPFCSSAVARPLLRSLTKSFGSICKGSLILQPAQALTVFGKCCCFMFGTSDSSCTNPHIIAPPDGVVAPTVVADESAADSVGLCQSPCCGLTDGLGVRLRSCNRWAYTYIGMYGYGFAEAGERAYQLFATREWLEVVKDNLIQNVLLLANIVIGGSTGTFAVIVEEMDGYDFTSFHKPVLSAFVVGSVIGYVMSNILMLGVVGSAVNTILVCFAAGPFEFDKNHPRLSGEMREAWTQQVWEPPV